ncbi:MAG: hypothetical protein KDA64_04280, partial [Rhodospirillaceae bacterium]|nr:hypothetical protein [Rhodospirillaceae bacterium]
MLAVSSPIWLAHMQTVHQWTSMVDQLRDDALGPLAARLSGAVGLASSVITFVWPLLLVLAVAVPRAFDPRRPVEPAGLDPVLARLVRDMLATGIVLMLGFVLVAGLPGFNERYMLPLLFAVPIYAFGRVLRVGASAAAARRSAAGLAGVTVVVLAVRLLELTPFCPQRCAELVPYDRLADTLKDAGFEGGTIVTGALVTAGNHVVQFPGSRVLMGAGPAVPARQPAGSAWASGTRWTGGRRWRGRGCWKPWISTRQRPARWWKAPSSPGTAARFPGPGRPNGRNGPANGTLCCWRMRSAAPDAAANGSTGRRRHLRRAIALASD